MTSPSVFAAPVDVGIRFSACGAGAAEVLVRGVVEVLVGRVGVDRGHQAVPDADRLVQDHRNRGEAVGGAGGVGDDVVALGVVDLVVDAQNEVGVRGLCALRGRREDHLAGAGLEVEGGVGTGAEAPGALDHDVDAELVPRQRGGLALRRGEDPVVVDLQVAVAVADRARKAAVDGVEGEQVRERGGVGHVVDGDDLEVGASFDGGAQHAPSDAAEPIDGDACRHADPSIGRAGNLGPGPKPGHPEQARIRLRISPLHDRAFGRMWGASATARIAS